MFVLICEIAEHILINLLDHNVEFNSSLILWPSDFICFSKSYDQQFGGLKEKNKWTTLMRAIIIKQYYHYKFNLELNI